RAAADTRPTSSVAVAPEQIPRLVLDAGRPDLGAPDPDGYRVEIHGEEQIRFQVQRSFPLVPTAGAIGARPGLVQQSIGQNYFLRRWLRLTPRLMLRDTLAIVAQADLVGLVAGERARDTRADATPRDRFDGFSNVQPRWLFAEW